MYVCHVYMYLHAPRYTPQTGKSHHNQVKWNSKGLPKGKTILHTLNILMVWVYIAPILIRFASFCKNLYTCFTPIITQHMCPDYISDYYQLLPIIEFQNDRLISDSINRDQSFQVPINRYFRIMAIIRVNPDLYTFVALGLRTSVFSYTYGAVNNMHD